MKTFTSEELASYAKQFAQNKYDCADKIYKKFRANLNQRIKRSQATFPTPELLERQSMTLAGKAFETLNNFSEEAIERKLDPHLKIKPGTLELILITIRAILKC